MYIPQKPTTTKLNINETYIGERIELKINRIVNNNEPIKDGAPIIYTERKEGVLPEHDIRTDRWEIAIDAMDKKTATGIARREQRIGEQTYDTMSTEQQTAFDKKFPKNKHALERALKDQQQKGEGGA